MNMGMNRVLSVVMARDMARVALMVLVQVTAVAQAVAVPVVVAQVAVRAAVPVAAAVVQVVAAVPVPVAAAVQAVVQVANNSIPSIAEFPA
jgi:hypothetical protein